MIEKYDINEPLSKTNFTCDRYYEAHLTGQNAPTGQVSITKEEIDELRNFPELTRLSITGLNQETFEYFIENYGKQFKAIYFFKMKTVSDLSPLENLKDIETICLFLNQRVDKLWDLSQNTSLQMLSIDDFSLLKNLAGIERAPQLKYFEFGNAVWAKSEIDIVNDMSETIIESISYNANVSPDNVIKFLQIPHLKELSFKTNAYKTEFIAWICSNYPNITGYSLKPYVRLENDSVQICGKGKPFISNKTEKDKIRIEKSVHKFEELKKKYFGLSFEEIKNIIDIK